MPAAITCPRCRHHFLLSGDAGAEVECPKCHTRLKVRLPSPSADGAKTPAADPTECLRKHYPDLSDEDAQLMIALIGADRCRVDESGLAPIKQTPRPSQTLGMDQLRGERQRAASETAPPSPRLAITTEQQFYTLWITVTAVGLIGIVVGAGFMEVQWGKTVAVAAGLVVALLGASTLYRHLRGQEDPSDAPAPRGSPQGAIRAFYEQGVLEGKTRQAHVLLTPSLRQRTTPEQLKAAWARWMATVQRLLALQQFQAHIYEKLGPGFDVDGPHYHTKVAHEVKPTEEGVGQGQVTITVRAEYTIHEQEAYRSWNREYSESGQLTCVYRAPLSLVLAGDKWLVVDLGPGNLRMVEFYGEDALEAVRFEAGAVAEGQLDVDVAEALILSGSQKLKKRGWF